MRVEEAQARKEYIKRVRQSFDAPGRSYEFEKKPVSNEGETNEFWFAKLRFIIAALLFAAYVFCDQTGMKVYRYSAGEVAEKIAKNYDYIEAKEEVMQALKSLD